MSRLILMCLLLIGLWCLLFLPHPCLDPIKSSSLNHDFVIFCSFYHYCIFNVIFSVSVVIPVYKKHTHLLTCSTSMYYHIEKIYISFACLQLYVFVCSIKHMFKLN